MATLLNSPWTKVLDKETLSLQSAMKNNSWGNIEIKINAEYLKNFEDVWR